MDASIPDLLRLLALPVFGWAAWRDVKTRRVPNRTWLPLAGLGLLLVIWEATVALTATPTDVGFFLQLALSIGFIVPLTTAFWWMGSFGGADAKAFYVIALLFPAYPLYSLGLVEFPGLAPTVLQFPLEAPRFGVFSLAILSNTVVVGVTYPLAVALSNVARRTVGLPMVIGKPVTWEAISEEYGLLLETPDGYTRRGLDLDALRMYLQWRGCSLSDLRADAATYRDPATVPDQPYAPGDGSIAPDGGGPQDDGTDAGGNADRTGATDRPADPAPAGGDAQSADAPADVDDPWGAERFLEDLDGSAYGTTPEGLREGLDVLVERDEVWISPGIPFLVPTFVGLLVALVYGDLLFSALAAVGLL